MSEGIKTLGEIFEPSVKKFPDKLALKKGDVAYSYAQLKDGVIRLKGYLLSLGLKQGEKFAVIGENRPEWAVGYLAILRAGLVVVPIDRLLSEVEIVYILRKSEAKGIIASESYLDKIHAVKAKLKDLDFVIPMNSYDALKVAKDIHAPEIDPNSLAVLIFTSGTTGTAKGVMLSHHNIISNVRSVDKIVEINENDTFVSVLPMHHMFESAAGLFWPLHNGSAIHYPLSLKPKDLLATMKEAKMTRFNAVPLLYEKFLSAVHRKVASASVAKRVLFKAISGCAFAFKPLRKPLFAKVRREIGFGHLRMAISAGAVLTEKVRLGLELLAVPIVQGYGSTEVSCAATLGRLENRKSDSVGPPMPDIEVRIDNPDENGIGEIVVRGPNVMLGYYKNQKETDEVLNKGWLCTGDLGRFDKEGYLYITGRKKSLIITQTGKNIYPEELEGKLMTSQWMKEVLVVPKIDPQSKKESICALIFPDYELLEQYSIDKGVTLKKVDIESLFKDEIKKINEYLPAYKKITQFEVREEEFPKTTTQKIKRHMFAETEFKV